MAVESLGVFRQKAVHIICANLTAQAGNALLLYTFANNFFVEVETFSNEEPTDHHDTTECKQKIAGLSCEHAYQACPDWVVGRLWMEEYPRRPEERVSSSHCFKKNV